MARDLEKPPPKLRKPPVTAYEVGYGKPPISTRFQKGQSGNLRGRPKGAKNKRPRLNEERLKDIILEEAYRVITVHDGNRNVTIPMAQAIVRSLAVNAAKGNQRAQQHFTELLSTTERDNKRLHDELLETAISYKVGWKRALEERRRLGVSGPDPLPHPDDILIDMRTGCVQINGPMTLEEKVVWDEWRERKADFDAEIEELHKLLSDKSKNQYHDQALRDLEDATRIRAMIAKVIPD